MGNLVGPVCVPSTLPGCAKVLPVELKFFQAAVCSSGIVCLDWVTVAERNNAYFELEILADLAWRKIGEVAGQGTQEAPELREYQFLYAIGPGTHHFRLSQRDLNGRSTLLGIEAVEMTGAFRFAIHPNPSNGRFTLEIPAGSAGAMVTVIDQMESRHFQKVVNESDFTTVDIDLTLLAKGMYFLQIELGGQRTVQRLVIL